MLLKEMNQLKRLFGFLRSPALAAVWRWSHPARGRVGLICLMTVAASGASLVLTMVTKSLIDGAVSKDLGSIWRFGGMLAALMLFERVLGVLTQLIRIKASAGLQRSMQSMLASALLSRDYSSIKPYHSGELVNRFFSDVSVVKNGFINILPSFVRIIVSFLGASYLLIRMDWRFVPVLIMGGLASLFVVLAFRRPMKQRHRRMQEAEGALHASAQETLENVRLIKASTSEQRAERQLGQRQMGLENEQLRQGRFSIRMNTLIGSAFDLTYLACMLWGCVNISKGVFTYGSLAALLQLMGRIQGPIANAVTLAGQVYAVMSSAERLQEIVGLPQEEKGQRLASFDEICLKNVSFRYQDGAEDVLKDVSFTIRRGDFVALTGVSGGGKTSLFQLLLGIYRPSSGSVTFASDGKSVPASRGTRELFAYVPQGNTLMSGTLRENLAMFKDGAGDEELLAAADAACIGDLVREIGLDAPLSERGGGLSEGQAQRVAVARALVSGAQVLLLDEATSALDEETEKALIANLSAMRDKTCIIVTHRRAALAICDTVLHISGGRVSPVQGEAEI